MYTLDCKLLGESIRCTFTSKSFISIYQKRCPYILCTGHAVMLDDLRTIKKPYMPVCKAQIFIH